MNDVPPIQPDPDMEAHMGDDFPAWVMWGVLILFGVGLMVVALTTECVG